VSKAIKVTTRTSVHLTYFTAWPDADGRIVCYDDLFMAAMLPWINATAIAAR
jgi:murein L,D-transpeptidase YcbB/YkuD